MSNHRYRGQVDLLLRIIPLLANTPELAIHGGTAINLFLRDLPRYSVDIDLTYIPVEDRETSLLHINQALARISELIGRRIKGVTVQHLPDRGKLLCSYRGNQVKVEVNLTKRGIVCGLPEEHPLCPKAQEEFGLYCTAQVVPTALLYGGKVAAALSRQHPRDLFDVHHMEVSLEQVRYGLLFYLLGSDKPILESLSPNLIDQSRVMETQFNGMTNTPFSYQDYEATRENLIAQLPSLYSPEEKAFIYSFEQGDPLWQILPSEYSSFQDYPSIQWKLLNIRKLQHNNKSKAQEQLALLHQFLFPQ